MSKSILVYLGATSPANPIYEQAVRQLGEEIARRGWTLIFGGSRRGTMEVLADAVLGNGGKAVGVFTRSLPKEFLYEGLTETVVTEDLAERKRTMLSRADVVVAMPGSFGTWDELFDAVELSKIEMIHGRKPKTIAVLNLDGYYNGILEFIRHSIEVGFTETRYTNLLQSADSVPELMALFEKAQD